MDWEHVKTVLKKIITGRFFCVTKCILFVCRESRNLLVNTESVKCEVDVTGKVYEQNSVMMKH